MKKQYDGLEAHKIEFGENDVIKTSNCIAMIQLLMVDGVCGSPDWQQQVEYVGNHG